MRTKSLLIDFDDTLVDFDDAEAYAFYEMTQQFQIKTNQNDLHTFKNKSGTLGCFSKE